MIKAVVKLGCDAWLSIGLELGYKLPEITAATAGVPKHNGKLRAIIELQKMEIGEEATTRKLLEVCKKLPDPIYGLVIEELEREIPRV